ncbi:hypothetical protein QTH87_16950 [Variovorax sp. J22P168]|uniref:hypothetical protein n=1 Tax=Variovorax jilinensis TaxID=3053513 RepID=UPI0025789763|nr:hypothetical protein [Variovorax sp. J22P168]MDM0014128.1 hypothetical protein [Variovorax sp. J22P168]
MKSRQFASRGRERGIVLLFCLIVLVILLAGGVAVVRSMNSSLSSAGNIAFKRDLVNQGEQAVAKVMAQFDGTGILANAAASAANSKTNNYSAVTLETNERGVPLALLSNSKFDAVGTSANDIVNDTAKVTIRYVIDRLCNAASTSATLGQAGCVFPPSASEVRGGSSQEMGTRIPPPPSSVYRLSMRVTGPRDTQVFLQTSFAKPD